MIEHQHLHTNGVTLRVATAGPTDGPLVILLHGFPEGWFAWRDYVPALAEAGYRVLVPDQRGYGDSDKPSKVEDYRIDVLAEDVVGLVEGAGRERATIVGHDWGAAVAWWTALRHPDRVERMVILNVPHPWVMRDFLLKSPKQLLKSWYMIFFQLPAFPEWAWNKRAKKVYEGIVALGRPDAFAPEDEARYLEAWSRPGALRGMMNWYRAAIREALSPPEIDPRIRPPTLVLWGRKDSILGEEMVEPSVAHCDDGRIVWFDDATHWINHEERPKITAELLAFLASGD